MGTGAVYNRGRKIDVVELSTPPTLAGDWVRIRVAFAGLCGSDMHLYHGKMDARVPVPMVIGHEASGTVVEVGSAVESVKVGDRVVVRPVVACYACPACERGHYNLCHNFRLLGIDLPGCFQTLWDVPADNVHRLPAGLSFKIGALIEPLAVACHATQTIGTVQPGQYVVVIGGGPIGVLVALVAMNSGARVLLSEVSEERLQNGAAFGIQTINPLEEDLPGRVMKETMSAGADLVFEVSSSQPGATVMTRLPRVRGRMIVVSMFHDPPRIDLLAFFKRELCLEGSRVYEAHDYESAIQLAASSSIPLDRFISEVRPLADAGTVFREMDGTKDKLKVLFSIGGE